MSEMAGTAFTAGRGARFRPKATALHDYYGRFLCFVLIGYAILGRGFASLGIPPLYIGEIALLLGFLVVLRSGSGLAVLASVPSILLAMLIVLVVLRTIPYVGIYGMDAARDSVVVLYGLFAFIVTALLIEKPGRLSNTLAAYGVFARFFGFFVPLYLSLTNAGFMSRFGPNFPGTDVPFIFLRLGECGSHLAGVAVFALLGFCRIGKFWVAAMVVSICMVTVSRGAMLTCMVPMALAALASHQKKRFAVAISLAGAILAVGYIADLNVTLPGGRIVGPAQIVNGLESIIGESDEANLDGTKRFRLNWWESIINYTFHGPYFWSGKGFGVNLAIDDDFVVGAELNGPPLRSPHNVHMTMLARAGIPGLFLWIVVCLSWLVMMFRMVALARRHHDLDYANVFLWNACYVVGIIVDASFDVALEGPMLGIWFWCLFGFGIGATLIYRARISGWAARRRF